MLVITRKLGERIRIGDEISISLLEIKGGQIKLGIKAPENITIHRQEIYERIKSENLKSSAVNEIDLIKAALILDLKNIRGE